MWTFRDRLFSLLMAQKGGENGLFMKSSSFVDDTKLEDAIETRWTSQVVLVGKNPPANARDIRD